MKRIFKHLLGRKVLTMVSRVTVFALLLLVSVRMKYYLSESRAAKHRPNPLILLEKIHQSVLKYALLSDI